MNWATFGGSEFFVPGAVQIDTRYPLAPLSSNITEWYQTQEGRRWGAQVPSAAWFRWVASENVPCCFDGLISLNERERAFKW